MLGLASITKAMLAGVVAASKEATLCSAPPSHTRKSSCARPRTRVPSGAVTVHCISTSATRERITGATMRDAASDSLDGYACNSPVEESRENGISCSSMRGRGSFGFCAGATRGPTNTKTKTGARKSPTRQEDLASCFIEDSATKISTRDNLEGRITRDQ